MTDKPPQSRERIIPPPPDNMPARRPEKASAPQPPDPAAPAGWYFIAGGGRRYWDGQDWGGDPIPPSFGHQEPPNRGRVVWIIVASLVFTPLVGIIAGAVRMRKNSADGTLMIVGGIVSWALVVLILTQIG